MTRTRRIGSFTFGITLVVFGILFLLQMIAPAVDYFIIIKFWPVMLILLGVEILVENKASKTKECIYKYDIAAIFMIMSMGVFTMGLAGLDMLIKNGFVH